MKNNSLHITYHPDLQMKTTVQRLRCTSESGARKTISKKGYKTVKKAIFFDNLGNSSVIKLIIILLLSVSVEGMGQFFGFDREKPPNAIYLSYQPWDHGLGLRYDQHFWKMGAYGSASYGKWGLYQGAGLDDHVKLTLGVLVPLKDWSGNQHDFSIGLNRHFVTPYEVDDPYNNYDPGRIEAIPWSFELGLTIKMQRFTLGMRTDILRWEPCIDVGIPLNFKSRYHKFRKYNSQKCRL